jgi:molecular chaperone DnaJ
MPASKTKDYYKTLGVDRKADSKSIKAAFRKAARKLHPDVNPDNPAAEDQFKELNEAFNVLSEPASRKLYDRYGEEWERYRDAGFTGDEPAGRGPDGFFSTTGGGSSFQYNLNSNEGGFDFMQSMFGSRRGSNRFTSSRTLKQKGQDLDVGIELSFDDAFNGTSRRLDIQTPETCSTCGGTGVVRQSICPICNGSGNTTKAKTIEVKIPAGVTTGSRVRVAGQGGPGTGGGANGDVWINVTIRPDKRFERVGDNLKTDVDVPLYTAVLGGEIVVSTPASKVALSVPAGSQNGRVFRLRGKGMPILKSKTGERGDLLARLNVVIPTELSEHELQLFGDLQKIRQS